ncbi:MAG: alkaline phosphatase family protein [Geminicoccaceae bacterium]
MTRRLDPSPVVAICFEVAGPDQVAGWLDRGWMPNLRALRDRGASLALQSTADLSSGSIWPTVTTGTMPERHGQFFTHMQLEPGSYAIGKRYADDVPLPPFWDALEAAGLTTALIDVPQTRPRAGFRGVHVVGWGGEYPGWRTSSEPPELMAEIHGRFGTHPLLDDWRVAAAPRDDAECRRLCDDLRTGAATKAELSRWLFGRGPFDLFLTVFSETHWALHTLWHLIDPTHPRHDPQLAARHGGILREVVTGIDTLIGELAAARPESTVLVFSLSGMGPNYGGAHLLPAILERLGLGPVNAAACDQSPARRPWGRQVVAGVRRAVPIEVLDRIKRLVPSPVWDTATRRLFHAGAGWRRSRAFALPNDAPGAVRINLRGREPSGLVAPGAERDALLAQIEAALRELVLVDTGQPAVRDVRRLPLTATTASGLPDLVVSWAEGYPVEAVRSARIGELREASPELRTGAHRNEGVLIAAGPAIAARGRTERGRIVDLAPTIVALSGAEPPPALDGEVLAQLLR